MESFIKQVMSEVRILRALLEECEIVEEGLREKLREAKNRKYLFESKLQGLKQYVSAFEASSQEQATEQGPVDEAQLREIREEMERQKREEIPL